MESGFVMAKTLGEEQVSFTFSDWDLLDTI